MSALQLAHAAFEPYAGLLHSLGDARDLDALNALCDANDVRGTRGMALRFVPAPRTRMWALDYERRIVERGEIPTREGDRHDLWNALAWLAFPRTKLALSTLHVRHASHARCHGTRGPVRDAATLLDESGALVLCADATLLGLWCAREWRELFDGRRAEVERALSIAVIGHGVLARLDRPFPRLTLRALVLPADGARRGADDAFALMDRIAASHLVSHRDDLACDALLPLPLAAWPGWDWQHLGSARFEDASVYRRRDEGCRNLART